MELKIVGFFEVAPFQNSFLQMPQVVLLTFTPQAQSIDEIYTLIRHLWEQNSKDRKTCDKTTGELATFVKKIKITGCQ